MKNALSLLGRVAVIFVLLCQALSLPSVTNAQSPALPAAENPKNPVPIEANELPAGYHFTRTLGVTGQPYPSGDLQKPYLNGPRSLTLGGASGTTLYLSETQGNRFWAFDTTKSTPETRPLSWAPYGTAGMGGNMYDSTTVVNNPQQVLEDPDRYPWLSNWNYVTIFNQNSGSPLASFQNFDLNGVSFDRNWFDCVTGIGLDTDSSPWRLFVTETCGRNDVLVLTVEDPHTSSPVVKLKQVIDMGQYGVYNPNTLLVRATSPLQVYVGYEGGLIRFTENGADWDRSSQKEDGLQIRGLALNPTDTDNIYAAGRDRNGAGIFQCDFDLNSCNTYIRGDWQNGDGSWTQVLSDPTGLVFDSAGKLYVADGQRATIELFDAPDSVPAEPFYGVRYKPYDTPAVPDPDGKFFFNQPTGVVVDAQENLYVLERNGQRLTKWDASGNFLASFGLAGVERYNGTTDGLNRPQGNPAIDAQGKVYIPDHNNGRVVILDSQLHYLGAINNLNCPGSVSIGPNGDIFISDDCSNTIQVYTADRFFRSQIGVANEPNGDLYSDNQHFNQPRATALIDENTLIVADSNNNRLQKCERTIVGGADVWACSTFAGVTAEWGDDNYHFGRPVGLAWDASTRRLLVSDQTNSGMVRALDENGKLLVQIGDVNQGGWGNEQFNQPDGLTVDSAGILYVTDQYNYRVQKYIPALSPVEFAGQLGGPISRMARSGTYLYAQVGARLGVFSLADPANPALLGLSDVLPGSVIAGPVVADGFVYLTTSDNALRIFSVDDPTHPSQVAMLPVAGPQGLAVSGQYAFVTSCCRNSPATRVMAVDVSTPADPQLAGEFELNMITDIGDRKIQQIVAAPGSGGQIELYLAARAAGVIHLTFDPAADPKFDLSGIFSNPEEDFGFEFVAVLGAGDQIAALDRRSSNSDGRLYIINTAAMTEAQRTETQYTTWMTCDGTGLYLNDWKTLEIYDSSDLASGPISFNIDTLNRPAGLGQLIADGSAQRIYSAANSTGLFSLQLSFLSPKALLFESQFKAPARQPGLSGRNRKHDLRR